MYQNVILNMFYIQYQLLRVRLNVFRRMYVEAYNIQYIFTFLYTIFTLRIWKCYPCSFFIYSRNSVIYSKAYVSVGCKATWNNIYITPKSNVTISSSKVSCCLLGLLASEKGRIMTKKLKWSKIFLL